jgi:fibronectin type 3 domain-containing protein
MHGHPVSRFFRTAIVAAAVLVFAGTAIALTPKESRDELDLLVYIDPQLRMVETPADADDHREGLSAIAEMDAFRAQHGDAWRFTIDLRRGVPTLLGGGAISFIPGNANDLVWDDFAPGCVENSCLPVDVVESLARAFMDQHQAIFGVRSGELVLDRNGSGPFGASIYLLRFQWTVDGIAVENASVFFRINNGNLIQVAIERIADLDLNTSPSLSRFAAIGVLEDYLGPFGGVRDTMMDEGSMRIVPVTPEGQDPDEFTAAIGAGIDYRLAWRFAFQRDGVIGTWEALVDAHSGDLIRFVDTNRYGRVHGGAYPGDNHTGEADRPFPFADTGLPAPDNYADAGGVFPGDNATTTLRGKYARINDSCGTISNTTTTGDVDFSLGSGTDCDVPPGNTGGAGNTHAARTQYYHLTTANLRAQSYLPGNSWLQNSFITINTNQSPLCNAGSNGGTVNFYRGVPSSCWNLGEIPGVALHEWGHSFDNFDGSGGQSEPVETYADWMASLHLHDSCVGRGFYLSGNCGGYGDPCTNCSGIRDVDYTQHQANTPWSAANFGSVWSCGGGSYQGPCGVSDHCESGISSQAMWDFVNRKVTAPPYNLDQRTAWLLADHLWYHGVATLGFSMYNCSIPNSDGCSGASLYNTMMAVDDDGDGTDNGTPHAAAIFSALDDHNIACGLATDPKNQDQSSCPSLVTTTASGQGLYYEAEISWTPVTNSTRYFVFRNDIGCDAGMTKIAEVNAPNTSYTDTTVVNNIEYYYLVQAAAASDSCTSPVSNCVVVTPIDCTTPGEPTNLTATAAGDNQISLSWTNLDPVADSFSVYRAIGSCPQSDYELIAEDLPGTNYLDTTVSGGLTYSYVVTAKDITGGCESLQSACDDAQTTGDCTEAPAFDGLQSVTNAGLSTCTLDLDWDAGVEYCGGPLSYNVYRSITPGFVPDGTNRIATGVAATDFSDAGGIDFEVDYYYVVRAVDGTNGVEDDNLVELSDAPTGFFSIPLEDDFESGNQGWVFTDGTPPASTGDFLIGDPVGTQRNTSGPSQPEDDHTAGGDNCLYTDENPGGNAGVDDIDGGEVIATSPSFDGSGVPGLTLDMWRWFSNEDNDGAGDYYYLEVSNDDGASWTELENIPGTITNTNSWMNVAFDLENHISLSPTMKIRVRAANSSSNPDLVELAIDDITIDYVEACESAPFTLPFQDGFESGDTTVWSTTGP